MSTKNKINKYSTSTIIISKSNQLYGDDEIDISLLKNKNLYKTLSLLEAFKLGIPLPRSYLALDYNKQSLNKIIQIWELPLIARVDFTKLPILKVLGGYPLFTKKVIHEISLFLFKKQYHPLFHPYMDRFENLYSIGILIKPDQKDIYIEVLGKGFDAGDLRLGKCSPHELISVESPSLNKFNRLSCVSKTEYERDRGYRIKRVEKMREYINFINSKCRLLTSLDRFSSDGKTKDILKETIPENYYPIPINTLHRLSHIIEILFEIINKLPFSKEYVASFSYFNDLGWILWDIYGEWYKR